MKFDELILIDLTGLYEISSFIYLKSYPIYPWNWYTSLHNTQKTPLASNTSKKKKTINDA